MIDEVATKTPLSILLQLPRYLTTMQITDLKPLQTLMVSSVWIPLPLYIKGFFYMKTFKLAQSKAKNGGYFV